ncbi:IAA-alanine resistance protein 1-like isoform X2 [Hibiscus syriacus]|uniref:IAA-alanine resistance protein 1-like isoform X2 n=1 Tax=Hibiscus syriacus TaxID=106335 RepID=UPI001923DE6F|nr:IAA-alanine resistance protein 1-like isoform X2 [Hibiscus syriacus]
MGFEKTPIFLVVVLVFVSLDLCVGSGYGMSPAHGDHGHHHHCDHGHGHDHHHHQHRQAEEERKKMMLPEELAEEEDMKLYGFGPYRDDHDHDHHKLSDSGLWLLALGCSLLVSLASLICLIILPVIFIQGKPSKAIVDSLALFGAGAMLGDAFLHQLPLSFGGGHSHSHADHVDPDHTGHDHTHAHSLKDLSVGLSVLAGIVLFLLVEKLVRYVEENSGGGSDWSHGLHHHHHKSNKKLKNDADVAAHDNSLQPDISDDSSNADKASQPEIRKRKSSAGTSDGKSDIDPADDCANSVKTSVQKETSHSQSNLVFGYLNLFSDGVHNFTDGMALGSAFLLHGSVGGWSRTLFLLAHELPQEIGDFGILVRSGFSVSKALFFNFLSALVALAGTAMALLWGQDPGQSSLVEGFTAGGFIYIAVAGVLAEMNNSGKTTLKNTAVQLISLTSGMAVALCIALVE